MSEPLRWRCGHEAGGVCPPSYVALRDCPRCRGVIVAMTDEPRWFPAPEIKEEPEIGGRRGLSAGWLTLIGFVAGWVGALLWRWLERWM